jgi:transposase
MGRRSLELKCKKEDREELERLSRSHKESHRAVQRAKIVLSVLDGISQNKVAQDLDVNPNTVSKWVKAFSKNGLKGLEDAPRSGKPKTVGQDIHIRILEKLEEKPPNGLASWDGVSLSEALGVKRTIVYDTLRKNKIQLKRMRSWCVSTDKAFVEKSTDVIGLYLNPPENAIVFCVDEKPTIQALSRKTGYVQTSSGKIVKGLQSTYRRNGTLNLFAALSVATGEITSKTTKHKKKPDFQEFMDDLVKDIPLEQEVHVILDNYCTHKKNEEWLKDHPNVTFHFTPTSASWLNMVEIWLGILTKKALKGASFNSTEELAQAIEDFCKLYNATARPFVWKKREVKGAQLRYTIKNLSQ